MFGEKRVEKKKTPIYKCNLNPTFNQVRGNEKTSFSQFDFPKKKTFFRLLNLTFLGSRFVIVLLTYLSWILTPSEGMSWSEDFNLDVSVSAHFISPIAKKAIRVEITFLVVTFLLSHARHIIDNYEIFSNKEKREVMRKNLLEFSFFIFKYIKVGTPPEVMRQSNGKRWLQSPDNQPWSGTGDSFQQKLDEHLFPKAETWWLKLTWWLQQYPSITSDRIQKICVKFCIFLY